VSKRLAFLGLVAVWYFALGGGAALGDGCPPQTCGTTGTQPPGSSLVFLRPSGQQGTLVGYDVRSGAERFRLGSGLLSADGTRFVTGRRTVAKGVPRSLVTLRDVSGGSRVVGRWALDRFAWPVALSADGYRIVLQERSRPYHSRFAILDAARGRVVRRVDLPGAYQAEALSPDARRLYLLHWTERSYDLRTLDLVTRKVTPTRLADPDEKMTGTATVALATPDGRWLLTLYAGGEEPFVHALDLKTGIAHCIDLLWEGVGFETLGTAAPAISADRRTLYLANPLLGRIAVIDLQRLRVVRSVRFTPLPRLTSLYGSWPAAAISPRGRVLAFGAARFLWLYDTAYGIVRGPFAGSERVPARTGVPANVAAVGFAPGGRRVLALTSDRAHRIYDAGTGARIGGRVAQEFTVSSGNTLLGYSSAGGPRFVLPDGHRSADGTGYFASHPLRGRKTAIERYSPTAGTYLGAHVLAGRWTLGAVSPSARTLAVARHARGTTWLRLLDARSGRTIGTQTLRGVYTLDAVSDDARRIFLIQHLESGGYVVRALDVANRRLRTATIREKGETESPILTGRAAGQVATPDGRWLLTLYLDTRKREAFIHALDLRRAAAVCIDLPGRATVRRLFGYSLALTREGVVAANGGLGLVAHIDLRRQAVISTLRFQPSDGGPGAGASSPGGRTVYFASGRYVWSYDVARGHISRRVAVPGPVAGFGFSRDGRSVYAARADGGVVTLTA
jgi:hypothetical protein